MKQILFLLMLQLVFSCSISQTASSKRELKLISVSGDGYQRGYQHGRQLKKEIAEVMVLWKKNLESSMKMPADSFLNKFFSNTDFTPAIKKHTPDVWEEVRGIADGAEQPFKDMLAFQLVDEYWVFQDQLNRDTTLHHCSDIAIPARNGQPAYVSQNMDLQAWMDGYQIVLHIQPHKNTPEQYLLSCTGLVALTGINEHGIGVCVNTLMQLRASNDGLPVAFMIRGLLEKKKGTDALSFLQNTKHASGQNYFLGVVDSVYDFEASARKVVRMLPDASGILYHTNHPIVNDDVKPWYNYYYQRFLAGKTLENNSEVRYYALQKRINESSLQDDDFIKATLRSKDDPKNPICRANTSGKGGFTFGSVILTLSNKRTIQVTAGPPDESEYKTFSFSR